LLRARLATMSGCMAPCFTTGAGSHNTSEEDRSTSRVTIYTDATVRQDLGRGVRWAAGAAIVAANHFDVEDNAQGADGHTRLRAQLEGLSEIQVQALAEETLILGEAAPAGDRITGVRGSGGSNGELQSWKLGWRKDVPGAFDRWREHMQALEAAQNSPEQTRDGEENRDVKAKWPGAGSGGTGLACGKRAADRRRPQGPHAEGNVAWYGGPQGERARLCADVGNLPSQAGGPGKEDAAPAEPTQDVELVMAMQPHLLAQPEKSETVVGLAP